MAKLIDGSGAVWERAAETLVRKAPETRLVCPSVRRWRRAPRPRRRPGPPRCPPGWWARRASGSTTPGDARPPSSPAPPWHAASGRGWGARDMLQHALHTPSLTRRPMRVRACSHLSPHRPRREPIHSARLSRPRAPQGQHARSDPLPHLPRCAWGSYVEEAAKRCSIALVRPLAHPVSRGFSCSSGCWRAG